MRLISQKSLPYYVDVPYNRVWMEVKGSNVYAYDGIQRTKLGAYSSEENALKAINKLHTKMEQLGGITDYRIFVFPEEPEL